MKGNNRPNRPSVRQSGPVDVLLSSALSRVIYIDIVNLT